MPHLTIAPETINLIYGQLNGQGNPDDLVEGYTYQNGLQGQMELPAPDGHRNLRSQLLQFTAEVVLKDDKLEWEIKSIQIPGDEFTKLIWQSQ